LRRHAKQSQHFARLKSEVRVPKNSLGERFVHAKNRRLEMIARFGATAGQGVVWSTGQFYALTFLQKPLNQQRMPACKIVSTPLVLGMLICVLSLMAGGLDIHETTDHKIDTPFH